MAEASSCGTRFARLVDRAFVGDLAAWRRRALRRHLRTCHACAERYDRLAVIQRQLDREPISASARDDIAHAVLATGPGLLRWRAMWVGVGSLAAAGIVLMLLFRANDDRRSDLRPRGASGTSADRTPGLRLFCIGHGSVVLSESHVTAIAGLAPPLRCTLDAELQVAYSTPNLEGLTMVAFGRRDQTIRYYAPRSADAEAVHLTADRIDEPLGWSTRLGVKHERGAYDIIVRFFDRPVVAGAAVAGEIAPLFELHGRMEIIDPEALHDPR